MKLLKNLVTMIIILGVSDMISRSRKDGDYIEDSYMPLIRTQSGLSYVVKNYPYVVAYIYTLPSQYGEDTGRFQKIDDSYNLMQDYVKENSQRYADSRVKFIGVNSEHGDLKNVYQHYGLQPHAEYLLFFKNRKLLYTHVLGQHFSRQALEKFIDATKLEDFVDERLAELAREENRDKQKCRYYGYSGGYYYGCCGPAWGYGPYWGGCYGGGCGGCYSGWGGCNGWYRPACVSFGCSFSV